MTREVQTDSRSGPRYLVSFEVRAEWDEPGGNHIMSEGTTENVGPAGTLVHLPRRLPDVGSRVRLEVTAKTEDPAGSREVLRIERKPGQPLAGLQLLGETDEWRGMIWEPAAPRVTAPPLPITDDDEDDEEEDDFAN